MVAGKPSTSEPRKRPPHLSLPSLSFLPVNATAPQKKPFPMLLGSVNFPSSDLPLVNRITFWILILVSECTKTWLPVTC